VNHPDYKVMHRKVYLSLCYTCLWQVNVASSFTKRVIHVSNFILPHGVMIHDLFGLTPVLISRLCAEADLNNEENILIVKTGSRIHVRWR